MSMEDSTLALTAEQMQALGYRTVDLLVEHFTGLPARQVTRKAGRATMEARLREPLPKGSREPLEVLDQVERDVLGEIMHLDHPRFFAFVPSPSNFVSAMADALASGFNVFAGTWLEASGPTEVELVSVDWLRQVCRLPQGAGGLFVSGGSVANMTALAVARHVVLGDDAANAVLYCSDQTHSSIDRGLRLLGFRPAQVRHLASDDHYRLDPAGVRAAVARDRAAGRKPFCLVANAGTTNTGAVDPLPALAATCRDEGLWLHVDGAYGAAAALCPRGQALLGGLELADSLCLDPHKWLFQPYEIGCVLVRDGSWLPDTFHILPEYLQDIEEKTGEVNFCDRGIQLTRGFRALKLWMSLQVFGRARFEAAIERGFALAEAVEAAVRALPGWEVVTPAQMGIVTFRCAPPGMPPDEADLLNRQLVEALIADGRAMISSTVLHGRTVLRTCTINPRTTAEDVGLTVETLDRLAAGLLAARE